MGNDLEKFLTIGDLSKIVSLSTDTLRYYDDFGLVKPTFTSLQTGYRYYSKEQIILVSQIIELKEYGFSLKEIKNILQNSETNFFVLFQKRYLDLLREKEHLDEICNKLSLKILQMQEDFNMQKSILLTDDASFMRMVCRNELTKAGYIITPKANSCNFTWYFCPLTAAKSLAILAYCYVFLLVSRQKSSLEILQDFTFGVISQAMRAMATKPLIYAKN